MAHRVFNPDDETDFLNYNYSPESHPNFSNPHATWPRIGLGVRFEVLNFGTTDLSKRSREECFDEYIAYNESMADLGLFQPSIDYESGDIIRKTTNCLITCKILTLTAVNQRFDFWADPNDSTRAKSRTSLKFRSTTSIVGSPSSTSPHPQTLPRFSPSPAQLAVSPQLGYPRPNYAPITGTGIFYEQIEPTPAQLEMESASARGSGYVSVNAVSTKSYRSNSRNDDDAYETSSLSSSSYLHDSPSPLDLNDDLSSSDTGSNVADIDENDSTSQYSSDSDEEEDADRMAQRAAEGRLGDDMDHETHLVSGDIITSEGEVIHVGPTLSKPKFAFDKLKDSKVSSILPEFLAQMEVANRELEAEKAAGTLAFRRIEIEDDAAKTGPFIEMNLGLGVLEEVANSSTSSSDTEESNAEQGVMERLMGGSRKRARDDFEAGDEDSNINLQKKVKLIEEL